MFGAPVAPASKAYPLGQRLACLDHPIGEAICGPDVFVTGETEVDEPLAVEQPRRPLQQRDPPPIALNQIIIGGEDLDKEILLYLFF